MIEDISVYKIRKLIYNIMFDFYDNDFKEESYLFDLSILQSLKNIIEYHVKNGDLCKEVISNINNFLQQARYYEDENKIERINIINEIIVMMNNQKYDDLQLFYRLQLIDRRNDFKYGIKASADQIKSEMNNIHEAICYDLVVLESHTEDVTDLEFITEYLPYLKGSVLYYESLNMILKENPSVFKNKTFYNRMMCILNLNNELYNEKEVINYNKKIVKRIDRKIKKV